jgi:hypothetical protein
MILQSGARRQPQAGPRDDRFPPAVAGQDSCVKGDWVEIVIDAGGEDARTYEVTATKAGRRVEIANRRGVVEVSEVTRSGTPVRTARFMSSRILALVEHPATDQADPTAARPED